MRLWITKLLSIFLIGLSSMAAAYEIEKVVGDVEEGWAIGFLPDGGFLVTLRDGALDYYDADRNLHKIDGLPPIAVDGQGGLLDLMIPRDFEASSEIFFSYAKPETGTALAKAKLNLSEMRLGAVQEIFAMKAPGWSSIHFGGRIVEADDGTIFLTLGDRGNRDEAQNPASHNGSVVRLRRDGGIPKDNGGFALPEIYSIGHRNPQGAAVDASGQLYIHEHGAQGGDEINLIKQGANYGWPVISYGTHYNGLKIGEGTEKAGIEQPEFYWDPSIAPSGFAIHSGQGAPNWAGRFFVGSLKFDQIQILEKGAGGLRLVEVIETAETGRVRDVREAPDGSIWFISVNNRAIYRIAPE